MQTPRPSPPEAPGADPVLVESFTRVVALFHVARVTDAVAALDTLSFRQRAAERRVWAPPSDTRMEQLTRFFLPSVTTYLAGRGGAGAHCAARHSDPAVLRYRGLTLSTRERTFVARLNGCELYVFGTGVLALVFDLSLERVRRGAAPPSAPTLANLAEFNHLLRKNHPAEAPRLRMEGSEAAPAATAEPLLLRLRGAGATLAEAAGILLAPAAAAGVSAQAADECAYRVQSYARLPEGTELGSLAEPLFRLRRVVGASYQVAPRELALDRRADVLRTWGNVVLGVSLEGMSMVVVDTGHAFAAEFAARARGAYFAHYLLALHQRAALRHLALQAAGLPAVEGAVSAATLRTVQALRAAAANFTLHHRFSQVSSATSYVGLYRRLVSVLGVPGLLAEIRDEVSELDEVLRRSAEAREAERGRVLNYLVAVVGIVAVSAPLLDQRLGRLQAGTPVLRDAHVLALLAATAAGVLAIFLLPPAAAAAPSVARRAMGAAVRLWTVVIQRPAAKRGAPRAAPGLPRAG